MTSQNEVIFMLTAVRTGYAFSSTTSISFLFFPNFMLPLQYSKRDESFRYRMHYLEYLSNLIWKHSLDTLSILSSDDLETLVRRASLCLPPRPYGTLDLIYRDHLLKVLILLCVLFFLPFFCFLVCFPQGSLH